MNGHLGRSSFINYGELSRNPASVAPKSKRRYPYHWPIMSTWRSSSVSPPPLKRQKVSTARLASRKGDPSTPGGLTVYSWNVNGIQPFLQPSITSFFRPDAAGDIDTTAGPSLRAFLRRHQWPTLLFLQEIKVAPKDESTIKALEKAVKAEQLDEPDYIVHVCLPSDKHNARGFGGRVYGVASIIRKDFDRCVSSVRPVDWDNEGRLLVIETSALCQGMRLAIVNCYLVNGTSAWFISANGAVAGTRHDRKLQVHSLLQAECRKLEAEGFGIILAGDMNIARAPIDGHPNLRTYPHQHNINRADFEAKFLSAAKPLVRSTTISHVDRTQNKELHHADAGLGMIDTFRHLHPATKGYTYYPRGKTFGESCDRVDMIITSAALEQFLTAAGIHATPAERGPSDHVPLYAQFDFDRGENDRNDRKKVKLGD